MARGNFPIYALNGGEVSKNALGRVDVAKMKLCAQCQVNWLPWVIGAGMLRPGMPYVGEVLGDAACKTLPFVYSKTDTSLLELTPYVMRVFINETVLTRGAVATAIADGSFTGTAVSAVTSATTADGNATLHFTSVPAAVADGVLVTDTTAAVVPAATTVLSKTGTTVVMSANATGSGVGNGDTIDFGGWAVNGSTAGCTVTIGSGVCTLNAAALGGMAQIAQTLSIASGDQGKEHGLRVVITNGPVNIQIGSASGLDDYLEQTAIDTGTHSLAFTPTSGSAFLQIWSTDQWNKTLSSVAIEGAGAVQLPTPWAGADLPNLRCDQSGDEMYVACYGQQQQTIQRRGTRPGARGWSVALYRAQDGPFHSTPDNPAISLTPGALYGNTTITASGPFFLSSHAGALLRLFTNGQTNAAPVGASANFTPATRVNGVQAARLLRVTVSGTFSGVWTLQRSLDAPDSGFQDISPGDTGWSSSPTYSSTFSGTYYDDNANSTYPYLYDNVIAWYRLGFDASNVVVASASPSGGDSGGSYVVGDTLTLVGGTGVGGSAPGAATVSVASVDGSGGVTGVSLLLPGYYETAPTGPVATAGGTGSGATLSITTQASGLNSGFATMQPSVSTGGGWGIARILAVNSPTEASVEILSPFTSTGAATLWQISDWCAAFGWPTSVVFHEDRLFWFSGGEIPIAGSVTNDYTSYAEEDQYGNDLGDDGAILEAFGSGPMDTVSWGMSLQRLLMGREQSIASARASYFDQPMTPSDFVVRDCSDQGAMRLPAVKLGVRGAYVQQSNRRLYEIYFNAQVFDYATRDLTQLNTDIGIPGFEWLSVAVQPDHMLHLPRGDGQSAALLYDPDDDVEAWWRIMTLGIIEDVCVLPGDGRNTSGEQLEDLVYFVVNRTINGVTRRFHERLARRDQCVGASLNYQLDCALIYSGAPASTLQIPWLPLTTIAVWADGVAIGTTTTDSSGNFTMPDKSTHSNVVAGLAGAVIVGSTSNPLSNETVPTQVFTQAQGTLTVGAQYNGYPAEVFADIAGTGRPLQHMGSLVVAGGVVTLPNNQVASTIVACLGFVAPFQSAKLAYAAQGPTALAQTKKIDHLGLILYDTGAAALQFGQDFSNLEPMPAQVAGMAVPVGAVWSEFDGPFVSVPGEWDTNSRVCLLAAAPNPCSIGGIVVAMQTSERNG